MALWFDHTTAHRVKGQLASALTGVLRPEAEKVRLRMRLLPGMLATGKVAAAAIIAAIALLSVAQLDSPVAEASGPTTLGRTPWQVFSTATYVSPVPNYGSHGAIPYYGHAPAIPPTGDAGWQACGPTSPLRSSPYAPTRPLCPNDSTIGMVVGSRLPGCMTQVDFTFFQTLVDIPLGTTLTTFTIAMSGMDDGARITVFNSANPGGLVVPGSYVFLGGSGTANLAPHVVAGETNRVVITQMDDCAVGNNLSSAAVNLNGTVIPPTPPDTTPPVITPTVTGTLGNNGWYVSDINVSWTVTDPDSVISSQTGCGATTVTADTAGITFTCTATSVGGTASQSVTVKRDATAPAAIAAAAPAPNANGWNNTDVTVTFTGTDGMSGVASCTAPAVLGEGAGQSATGTCTDNAGNVSAPATASNINVDKTNPVITVTGVTGGATYTIGGVPAAGCTTTDALSGVATSATVSTSGGPLGTVTVTCAGATDQAGNAATSATVTYTVAYGFCGFKQPLLVPVQEFKTGSTIPVKFCVQDANGAPVTAATGVVEAYVNGVFRGAVAIRYTDGQYIANVQTKDGRTDWPTGALEFRVKLNDGSTHSTNALSTDGVKGGLKLR